MTLQMAWTSPLGQPFVRVRLLHASIADNLRYARPDATDAQIVQAARAAQIHNHIVSLPDGYETLVGARGHRFSGGEKQRIALTRTILRNPRILVLDNTTEHAVQAALDALAQGRTTVTIAHRRSTVRQADQIIVLDRGRNLERGTHDERLTRGGAYARLVHASDHERELALA